MRESGERWNREKTNKRDNSTSVEEEEIERCNTESKRQNRERERKIVVGEIKLF